MKFFYSLTFVILLGLNTSSAQTSLTEAVDFTVTTVHGETYNLFEILDEGKHVVIDFFFTTCGPCIASVPSVNANFERFGCNKGDVIFLAIDIGDSDEEVLAYENAYGGLLPSASGIEGGGNEVNAAYGIGAWPTIVLIAPDRKILSQDIFPPTDANFNNALISTAGLSEDPDACLLPTSVVDIELGTQIKTLAPNPASDFAQLNINLTQSAKVAINIYNLMGQQVAEIPAADYLAGETSIQLPIAHLPNGTYTINLIQENRIADVSKLSIIH